MDDGTMQELHPGTLSSEAGGAAPQAPRRVSWLENVLLRLGPAAGVVIVLVVLCAVFAATQSSFATWANVRNILDNSSIPLIVAVGMTFVVLTTGFDLSVGAVLAGSGVLLAALMQHGVPTAVAILGAVAAGLLAGGVNGYLIGFLGLDFFVVTLGTMSAYSGLAYVHTNGQTVPINSQFLIDIGSRRIAGIPITVIVAAAVFALCWLALRFTVYGRSMYAIGNSREASRLAGIRVNRIAVSVYVISGLLAGIGGLLQVGQLASASPTVGTTLPLSSAAAVFLGGTALSGGVGGLGGTLLGVLLIGVISNGLDLTGVSSFWQSVVTGGILIAAIYLDRVRVKRLA